MDTCKSIQKVEAEVIFIANFDLIVWQNGNKTVLFCYDFLEAWGLW